MTVTQRRPLAVDSRNPEVSQTLVAWFRKRDELRNLHRTDKRVPRVLHELVEIGEQLVDFFCPTGWADRCVHTGEDPAA
ncbi:MAG: hypothetical protein JOY78_00230 [Pseudonocardia sp.]|nr:hypothetical protein [Pseudonocardia sp.]